MTTFRSGLAGAIVALTILLAAPGAPASAQIATSPISAARYTAFDMGSTIEIALERAVTAARIAKLEAFCTTLDAADPLLSALRESCEVSVDGYRAGDEFTACGSRADCLRTLARLRAVVEKTIRILRKANRVVDVEVPAGACRRALRVSSGELRSGQRLSRGLAALQGALRSGSAKRLKRAHQLLEDGSRLDGKLPSEAKQRKTFRAACGPPPVAPPPAPAPVS